MDALGGEPGVHSARYAEGTDHDSQANMRKLLERLGDTPRRSARFRTVITLATVGHAPLRIDRYMQFVGIVEGDIAMQPRGSEGFGYDPVFVPQGYAESFAQMGDEVKNRISHRARAVQQLACFMEIFAFFVGQHLRCLLPFAAFLCLHTAVYLFLQLPCRHRFDVQQRVCASDGFQKSIYLHII